MKFVIVLLSCLVGVSYQERYSPWGYSHYMPFYPIQYYYPRYPVSPMRQVTPEGRTPYQPEEGDGRFFFTSLSNINIRLAKTSTLTSYVFTTSSATAVVDGGTCLLVALFSDQAAAGTRCRRRRELAEFNDRLDALAPSPVIPMEVSAVVADLAEKDDFVQPIESSHVDENDRSFEDQENRSFLYITSFTTITSTLTTFSFSTTTNTVSLGNNFAADAALTCIPSGYFVC